LFPKSIHSARGWLIATRIAELRSAKGFTQRDLASLLGREHGLVSMIETCERRVELVELIQILTAIGCDVEFEIGRLVADLLKITTSDELDSPKAGRGKAGGR
jgi:transcriptional regulator with XRE-family HTH domain